ncbi:MAG: hypothetical protein OHK0038_08250 [Flammeovirgaceae bacterium]
MQAQTDSLVQQQTFHEADSFYVKEVLLDGNKKTKDRIILRELAVRPHQKIAKNDILQVLEKEKNKVFNTYLFVTVDVTHTVLYEDTISIKVSVIERWYIFPFPLFELADRNFNEWIRNRGADINRVNYGVVVSKKNFRGLNETIQLRLQFGFTPRLTLHYQAPFLDKQQTLGLMFRTDYLTNKVYDYATVNNKGQDTSRNEKVMFKMLMSQLRMSKRIGFYDFHDAEIRYRNMQIDSFIAALNPDYFLNGDTKQQFFSFSYSYIKNKRDFNAYPTKGYYFNFTFTKLGLLPSDDFNGAQVELGAAKYFELGGGTKVYQRANMSLGGKFFLATGLNFRFSTPAKQPYLIARTLGFTQYMIRGYDTYIAENQHVGIFKNTFRWKILDARANIKKIMPLPQFSIIPTAIYLKAYFDAGYIYNKNDELIEKFNNSRLLNKPLWGAGVGLDVVTFYNVVFRFECSYNPLDKKMSFFFYRTIEI